MAYNDSSYDPYSSPYRSNSYLSGAYGGSGAASYGAQQNAQNAQMGSSSSGGGSNPYANFGGAFADAASAWGPPQKSGLGSYFGLQQPSGSGSSNGGYQSPSAMERPSRGVPWMGDPGYNLGTNQGGGGDPSQWTLNYQSGGGGYTGPNRPGVTGGIQQPSDPSQWNLTGGAYQLNNGPNRPGIVGSTQPVGGSGNTNLIGGAFPINGTRTPTGIGTGGNGSGLSGAAPGSATFLDQSHFTTSTGQPDALAYYRQWLPNLTLDQLGQYWGGAGNGQRLDQWWNSSFNSDGTSKAGGSKTAPMPVTGGPDYGYTSGTNDTTAATPVSRFVPGYGWTQSDAEYRAAQQQVAQQGQQQQQGQQPSNGQQQPGASANTPPATGTPAGGTPTPSGVAPPANVQFPTAPGTGTPAVPGLSGAAPGAAGTPGAPGAPGSGGQQQTIADYLRGLLKPQFQQEQSDLNRQMLATAASTGDINSGGFAATAGKEQARLAANQGSRLTDYLTQASEAEKNRGLQTYQIDTNAAIAKMQDETSQFGIRTNDDLQRYLNSKNNTLAQYGIDKNDVLQRYIAIQNANHQSAAAMSAYNAAALQAATQQSIAAMNNQTALTNSQRQYDLGVLGINANNYQSDNSNLLAYLNLLLQSNPQAPQPQIPGVVGYGP